MKNPFEDARLGQLKSDEKGIDIWKASLRILKTDRLELEREREREIAEVLAGTPLLTD